MSTLYLSGPMTGIAEFNYPAFHSAAADLTHRGYRVLNPADNTIDRPDDKDAWEQYMRLDVMMIASADGIAHLPGWHRSRGAALEIFLGAQLGLTVMSVSEWLLAAPALSEASS